MIVSIIIAVKACCANLKECVSNCLNGSYKDFEIIILPDELFSREEVSFPSNVRIIPTGNITPPYKRDIGVREAKGDIIAFLDDDAYPSKNWLEQAIKVFKESENISCVCGPAVTPGSDATLQKASGLVYSSFFISGNHNFRYIPKSRREVSDFPSCNFLIKKDLFNKVGGFDKPFWPGEDTFLCLKVLETGQKMIYDPRVLVYHHRRTLYLTHLKQIKNYALHRGYFAKKYPKTSFCLEYFIPSLFVLGIIAGAVLSLLFMPLKYVYFTILNVYLLIICINSLCLGFGNKEPFLVRMMLSVLVFSGIILTHVVYGLYFVKGLLVKKMPEE